jgi:hypothetical protein
MQWKIPDENCIKPSETMNLALFVDSESPGFMEEMGVSL